MWQVEQFFVEVRHTFTKVRTGAPALEA